LSRSATGFSTPFAASDPGNAGWQRDLAVSHAKIADALRRMGRAAEALDVLRRGHAIMVRLTALSPDNATWKRDLEWFAAQIARSRHRRLALRPRPAKPRRFLECRLIRKIAAPDVPRIKEPTFTCTKPNLVLYVFHSPDQWAATWVLKRENGNASDTASTKLKTEEEIFLFESLVTH
jgi:hypothetical protein